MFFNVFQNQSFIVDSHRLHIHPNWSPAPFSIITSVALVSVLSSVPPSSFFTTAATAFAAFAAFAALASSSDFRAWGSFRPEIEKFTWKLHYRFYTNFFTTKLQKSCSLREPPLRWDFQPSPPRIKNPHNYGKVFPGKKNLSCLLLSFLPAPSLLCPSLG